MKLARGVAGAIAFSLCSASFAVAETPKDARKPPAASASAAPAPYQPPRNAYGQPSFEGVWTQNFLILLEATPQAPMLTLPEPAAKAMAAAVAAGIGGGFDKQLDPEVPELMKDVDGLPIVRTRTIVEPADGKIPYTPEARKESIRGYGRNHSDNPEERPNWERCVTSLGLPPISGMYTTSANPRQLIQTRDAIVIHTEYGDEARIIPFASVHKPKPLHSSLGDAIARWEGDTLVVETIGLPEKDRVRAFSNLIVPATAKVIERYTRLSDKELLYQYTVEDASIYTAPWLAEYSLYKTDQPMYEHACHEGNHSLPNILSGERVKEKRDAAKAALAAN